LESFPLTFFKIPGRFFKRRGFLFFTILFNLDFEIRPVPLIVPALF